MSKRNVPVFALAALVLAGCSANSGIGGGGGAPPVPDVAYLSISIAGRSLTRASSEEEASDDENALKTLYLVTFDDAGSIVARPGSRAFYAFIDAPAPGNPTLPEAVKVSAAAKNLVVIANPGPALKARLDALNVDSSLETLCAEIEGMTIDEIRGDETRGFAMITGGDETNKQPGETIDDPCVDIEGKIVVVTGTDAEAKTEAEKTENRVDVKLERLAAKLNVNVASARDLDVRPSGAQFQFLDWTVDVLNTAFFPFAQKTILETAHSSSHGSYTNNFYTRDPNYHDVDTYHTDLARGGVDPATHLPVLPWDNYYDWLAADALTYVTENTMAAEAQKYGNATRLVIRATYTPPGCDQGEDWFRWAGVNYPGLDALQQAYAAAGASAALKSACDRFYEEIALWWAGRSDLDELTAEGFSTLGQSHLDQVTAGGELSKDAAGGIVRWYKGGLNYYTYEIRHDNEADGAMAFGKYGVVRNNYYRLTLNSVGAAGTPWYPEFGDPEPDPGDPIDQEAGYLGISVSVGEWILWENTFGV